MCLHVIVHKVHYQASKMAYLVTRDQAEHSPALHLCVLVIGYGDVKIPLWHKEHPQIQYSIWWQNACHLLRRVLAQNGPNHLCKPFAGPGGNL